MPSGGAVTKLISQTRRVRTTNNLTEEQLSHKRHLDRKAQRALRQRTKSRIQDLEAELAELKAKADGQTELLQEELTALREKNKRLESRLQQILKLANISNYPDGNQRSPLLYTMQDRIQEISECISGKDQVEILTARPMCQLFLLTAKVNGSGELQGTTSTRLAKQTREKSPLELEDTDDDDDDGHGEIPVCSEIVSPEPMGGVIEPIDASQHNFNNSHTSPYHHALLGNETTPVSDYPAETYMSAVAASMPRANLEVCDLRSPAQSHQSGTQSTSTHSRIGVRVMMEDFYLDGVPSESPGRSIHSPESSMRRNLITQTQSLNQIKPVSSILCHHLPATCPLDRILLDFLTSRRALADSGTPTETLIGPERASMTAMLHPEMAVGEHPVSRVLVEVLNTFPHVKLPEKLAFMYLMHGTMRWQISPIKENYERLPHWLRPTAVQITTPHAAWIDNIPWPRVRDVLIEHTDEYPFEKFSEMYSHNVSVNWPYDEMDALFRWERDDGSSEMVLNNIFEKHILRLSNWTIAAKFEEVYPEMIQALR